MNNSKSLYLDLLKRSLTGYLQTDSDQASAMPLQWTIGKSWLKRLRNRLLMGALRRSHLFVMKDDRLSVTERRTRRTNGTDWPPHAETMVGLKRLDNLQWVIETILADEIPGDFIETGVWRGGATIFMRGVFEVHGVTDRTIWACDSFQGLPPPDEKSNPADAGDVHHTIEFLSASLEQVKENFRKYNLLDDKVKFVEGFFEDTLADVPVETLALLRLDGDMYGSTMVALEALYDKVVSGGFIIVDDYGLAGCRQAIVDFRDQRTIAEDITAIDDMAVYWRKS